METWHQIDPGLFYYHFCSLSDVRLVDYSYLLVAYSQSCGKCRRISTNDDDDDDALSDAETKSIPTMVRDWLTMTFTRSLTNLRLRQDRLRFRSVANAIRAGIVVDRSPITALVRHLLDQELISYYYSSSCSCSCWNDLFKKPKAPARFKCDRDEIWQECFK